MLGHKLISFKGFTLMGNCRRIKLLTTSVFVREQLIQLILNKASYWVSTGDSCYDFALRDAAAGGSYHFETHCWGPENCRIKRQHGSESCSFVKQIAFKSLRGHFYVSVPSGAHLCMKHPRKYVGIWFLDQLQGHMEQDTKRAELFWLFLMIRMSPGKLLRACMSLMLLRNFLGLQSFGPEYRPLRRGLEKTIYLLCASIMKVFA